MRKCIFHLHFHTQRSFLLLIPSGTVLQPQHYGNILQPPVLMGMADSKRCGRALGGGARAIQLSSRLRALKPLDLIVFLFSALLFMSLVRF